MMAKDGANYEDSHWHDYGLSLALDLHTVDLVAREYDSGFEYNVHAKTQKLGVYISGVLFRHRIQRVALSM
jgi:hypothetical protein